MDTYAWQAIYPFHDVFKGHEDVQQNYPALARLLHQDSHIRAARSLLIGKAMDISASFNTISCSSQTKFNIVDFR